MTVNTFVKELGSQCTLYRDPETGIAWIEDARNHTTHHSHPRVRGTATLTQPKLHRTKLNMLTGWQIGDRLIFEGDYIYNVSRSVVATELDAEAARRCDCGGNHNIPPQWLKYTDKIPVTTEIFIAKREGRAGEVKWEYTLADGIVVRISGIPGSYAIDLLDARFVGEHNAALYRVVVSRTIDELYGVFEFLRRADPAVVLATLENSIV